MSRKNTSGLIDDLIDLASMFPWWVGVALAISSYFILHSLAAPVQPGLTQISQVGDVVARTMWRTLAHIGQFVLPVVCLIGATVSALRRHQRRNLIKNVAELASIDSITDMTWHEFELLVGQAYRLQGYQVVETGGSGADGGVDLVLRKNSEKFFVQCKQWKAFKVGVDVVREMYGVMAAHGASGGFVVTSGQFTDTAAEFAQGRNLVLVDGPALLKLIQLVNSGPRRTSTNSLSGDIKTTVNAKSAAPLCPNCAKTMIRRSASRGKYAGQEFWGCSAYPSCKGIRSIE